MQQGVHIHLWTLPRNENFYAHRIVFMKQSHIYLFLKLKNLVSALTYPTPPTLIEAMQNSWNENSETYDYIL
jgi:hypothetical protein